MLKSPIALLSFKSLFRNKKHSFATIAVFFLAIIMVVSEIIVVNSLNYTREAEIIKHNGKQNGVLIDIGETNIANLQDYGFDKVGYIKNFAVCNNSDGSEEEHITIGTMDSTAIELSNITVITGRMPANEDEIAIEKSACDKLNVPEKIGQKVTLYFSSLDGMQEDVHNFTVVGIISNYSEIQINQYDAVPGFDTLPGIFVSNSEHLFSENKPVTHAMTFLKQSSETRSIYEDCMEKGIAKKCFYNTTVYPSLFGDNDRQNTLDFLKEVFISVVNIFSVVCLLTIFVILNKNITDKNRRIALAGATKGQILQVVLTQNIILFLIAFVFAFPIALLIGYVPSFFTTYYLLIPYPLIFVSIAIIFCVIIAANIFLTIYSFNENKKSKKTAKNKTNIKNPVVLWAVKHYKTNATAFIFPCISFAISIAVLSVSLFMYSANTDEFKKSNLSFDYKLSYYNGVFASSLRIPSNLSVGFSESDYNTLQSNTEIEKSWAVKNIPFNILINEENIDMCGKYTGSISLKEQADFETYKTELARYQYDENDELYFNRIKGFDRKELSQLKKFEIAGDINNDDIYSAKGVIVCVTEKDENMKIGDEITFTQLIRLGNDEFDVSNVQKIQFTAKVKAICVLKPDTPEAEIFAPDTVSFLWETSSFNQLGINASYNTIYTQLVDADCYTQIDKDIEGLKNLYPNMSFESRHQLADYYRNLQETLLLICFTIIVIVLISGTLSNATIMNARVKEQWNQFGLAIAAGMLKSQVKKYIFCEAVITSVVSWALGVVLSVASCAFLALSSYMEYMAFIPWLWIILSLPTILLICMISIILPLHSVQKESVINMLKRVR